MEHLFVHHFSRAPGQLLTVRAWAVSVGKERSRAQALLAKITQSHFATATTVVLNCQGFLQKSQARDGPCVVLQLLFIKEEEDEEDEF